MHDPRRGHGGDERAEVGAGARQRGWAQQENTVHPGERGCESRGVVKVEAHGIGIGGRVRQGDRRAHAHLPASARTTAEPIVPLAPVTSTVT